VKKLALTLVAVAALFGCDKDQDPPCRGLNQTESCSGGSDWYTCDGAQNCYETRSACEVSTECD
jgi:hypothetical protein